MYSVLFKNDGMRISSGLFKKPVYVGFVDYGGELLVLEGDYD